MADLLLHNKPVATVFDLLGQKENDMTFALAWGQALVEDAGQPGHPERPPTDIGNLANNFGTEQPCKFLGVDGHG